MDNKSQNVTRKSSTPIKVYCLPEERVVIEENASKAGRSVAAFLREIGQGYEVKGTLDYLQVRELVRVNGDLGRLGGLLKLWLADDARTANFGETHVRVLLGRIEDTQEEMRKIMASVMNPRKTDQ